MVCEQIKRKEEEKQHHNDSSNKNSIQRKKFSSVICKNFKSPQLNKDNFEVGHDKPEATV